MLVTELAQLLGLLMVVVGVTCVLGAWFLIVAGVALLVVPELSLRRPAERVEGGERT